MKEFMMIFRMAPIVDFQPTPEQLQSSINQWQDWIGAIAAQGKFVSTNQLGFSGKTLKPGGIVSYGPYAEVKEIVGGNIIVKANDMEDALQLAQGCPVLYMGGHVEVRDIMVLTA